MNVIVIIIAINFSMIFGIVVGRSLVNSKKEKEIQELKSQIVAEAIK